MSAIAKLVKQTDSSSWLTDDNSEKLPTKKPTRYAGHGGITKAAEWRLWVTLMNKRVWGGGYLKQQPPSYLIHFLVTGNNNGTLSMRVNINVPRIGRSREVNTRQPVTNGIWLWRREDMMSIRLGSGPAMSGMVGLIADHKIGRVWNIRNQKG